MKRFWIFVLSLSAAFSSANTFGFISSWLPACYNSRGNLVLLQLVPEMRGTAMAMESIPGLPLIVMDQRVAYLPQAVRDYLYLHECAHHVFEHPLQFRFGVPYTGFHEDQAVAWAANTMVSLRRYTATDFEALLRYLSSLTGDFQHRVGFLRAIFFHQAACVSYLQQRYVWIR